MLNCNCIGIELKHKTLKLADNFRSFAKNGFRLNPIFVLLGGHVSSRRSRWMPRPRVMRHNQNELTERDRVGNI